MKFFKTSDLLLVGVLLFISVVSWGVLRIFMKEDSPRAEVYQANQLVDVLPLSGVDPAEYPVPGSPGVVLALDGQGGIRFLESDCPDQICVHSGLLHIPGQFAACLPNSVVVRIVPGDGDHDGPEMILGNTRGNQ